MGLTIVVSGESHKNVLSITSSDGRWTTLKILIAERTEDATSQEYPPPLVSKQLKPNAIIPIYPVEPRFESRGKLEFKIPKEKGVNLSSEFLAGFFKLFQIGPNNRIGVAICLIPSQEVAASAGYPFFTINGDPDEILAALSSSSFQRWIAATKKADDSQTKKTEQVGGCDGEKPPS